MASVVAYWLRRDVFTEFLPRNGSVHHTIYVYPFSQNSFSNKIFSYVHIIVCCVALNSFMDWRFIVNFVLWRTHMEVNYWTVLKSSQRYWIPLLIIRWKIKPKFQEFNFKKGSTFGYWNLFYTISLCNVYAALAIAFGVNKWHIFS
jgi:hypothetical protein